MSYLLEQLSAKNPIHQRFYQQLQKMHLKHFSESSDVTVNSPFEVNRCWTNAINVTQRYGYRYCEGFLTAIPNNMSNTIDFSRFELCLHAWNLDNSGKIIDLTSPILTNNFIYMYSGTVFTSKEAINGYRRYKTSYGTFSGIIFNKARCAEILSKTNIKIF